MNESKKKNNTIPISTKTVREKKVSEPEAVHWKKLTDKDIEAVIGEAVPATKKIIREKEIKIPKPRKFKTHSEKKNFKNQQVGKK